MDREFIAERQHGLQVLVDAILDNPMLAASEITKKFFDPRNYNMNHTGNVDNCAALCSVTFYLSHLEYHVLIQKNIYRLINILNTKIYLQVD